MCLKVVAESRWHFQRWRRRAPLCVACVADEWSNMFLLQTPLQMQIYCCEVERSQSPGTPDPQPISVAYAAAYTPQSSQLVWGVFERINICSFPSSSCRVANCCNSNHSHTLFWADATADCRRPLNLPSQLPSDLAYLLSWHCVGADSIKPGRRLR